MWTTANFSPISIKRGPRSDEGLAAIRGSEWVAGIAQGLHVVKVSVADVRVEHEVKLTDFTKWLEKQGGSRAR
jgi:hypothetical protein